MRERRQTCVSEREADVADLVSRRETKEREREELQERKLVSVRFEDSQSVPQSRRLLCMRQSDCRCPLLNDELPATVTLTRNGKKHVPHSPSLHPLKTASVGAVSEPPSLSHDHQDDDDRHDGCVALACGLQRHVSHPNVYHCADAQPLSLCACETSSVCV